MITKIDLKKDLKPYFSPTAKEPQILEIPDLKFLWIDGAGNPNTSKDFQDAVSALYNLAYTMKFTIKKEQNIDYPVWALEALWWNEKAGGFHTGDPENWMWTAMILQPSIITEATVNRIKGVLRKKGKDSPALVRVKLVSFHEGLSAQILHIGPWAAEQPTIEKLHNYIHTQGYELKGKHHEVYLSDPRRAAPEKLKTIVRQPIKRRD